MLGMLSTGSSNGLMLSIRVTVRMQLVIGHAVLLSVSVILLPSPGAFLLSNFFTPLLSPRIMNGVQNVNLERLKPVSGLTTTKLNQLIF